MFNAYNYAGETSTAPRGNSVPNGINGDVFNPGPSKVSTTRIMGPVQGEMERDLPRVVPEDNPAAYTSVIHNIPVSVNIQIRVVTCVNLF